VRQKLSRRLEELERFMIVRNSAIPRVPSFDDQFAAVERCMLPLLSAEDRELWLRPGNEPPQDRDARARLDEAFDRAVIAARQPFTMSSADRWGQW
jgi:hypothetical protein